MNGESKQQELAEAILKVIVPLVEIREGQSDALLLQLASDHADSVLHGLQLAFESSELKAKQPNRDFDALLRSDLKS